MDKIALTGIKPTGTPHIGNYLGAIQPALLAPAGGHSYGGCFCRLSVFDLLINKQYCERACCCQGEPGKQWKQVIDRLKPRIQSKCLRRIGVELNEDICAGQGVLHIERFLAGSSSRESIADITQYQ